jgi:uncharacterized protein
MSPAETETLREPKRRLGARHGERLARVVLFGSRARGDDRPESDWDVAFMLDPPPSAADRGAVLVIAFHLSIERGEYLEAMVLGPADLDRSFWVFHDIRTEGIAV